MLFLLRDARISTQIFLRRVPEGGEARVTANLSFPYESDMDWRRIQRIALQWKSGVGVGDGWLYEITLCLLFVSLARSHGVWCQACVMCEVATGVEAWAITLFLVFEVSALIVLAFRFIRKLAGSCR